ncbi:MAG: hypothetical protein U0360_06580 [Dehalococcoidia bacterium]
MPDDLTTDDLVRQLGERYASRSLEARAGDLALLAGIRSRRDIGVAIRSGKGDSAVEVTVAAADQLGALAVLAGLFAAHGLDIRAAELFTVAIPRPATPTRTIRGRRIRPTSALDAAPSRLLLDIFTVATPEGVHPGADFQRDIEHTLGMVGTGELDTAMEHVIEGVAGRARTSTSTEPLYPLAIELVPGPEITTLFIQAVDTPGFLFEFAAALGTLRVNIAGAEVRTIDGETRDAFFLTEPDGGPITDPRRLEELRVAAALIKHFTHLLPVSAEPAQALRQFGALVRTVAARAPGPEALGDLSSPQVLQTLAEVLGVSRFLWEDFLRMQHENLFPLLARADSLATRLSPAVLAAAAIEAVAQKAGDAPEAPRRRLNELKDREMFRADLRHITGHLGFLAFSRELSDVAEATVLGAATLAHAVLRGRHGTPRLHDGRECGWTVCALGKFGGRELGYASDIELLFVYAGDGRTDGAEPISNHDYFEAFVRHVRDSISARQEGIFELDLRLRPYGTQGALATSLAAFEAYYSAGGAAEQFERLALVRLRPVVGDDETRAAVRALRDAWVYSGAPLDYADIAHLRHRQATELVRSGTSNAKYSPGGVVDLEYFVQASQIEVGATDPSVRVPGTLEGIELLSRSGVLPQLLAAKLQDAYGFMRRLIDGLRVVRGNAKDLAIPPVDSRAFAYLARRMHYESIPALAQAIEVRMDFGRTLWERFAPPSE